MGRGGSVACTPAYLLIWYFDWVQPVSATLHPPTHRSNGDAYTFRAGACRSSRSVRLDGNPAMDIMLEPP